MTGVALVVNVAHGSGFFFYFEGDKTQETFLTKQLKKHTLEKINHSCTQRFSTMTSTVL